MNDDKSLPDNEATSNEVWPRKLNKALIGIGVIAFGLIIADRLINTFRSDDVPEKVAIERTVEAVVTNDSTPSLPAEAEVASIVESSTGTRLPEPDGELKIEDVFGSPLVFVSASEPLYVITEDAERFDVGGSIDDETTLAGVTGHRVILERSGELMVVTLPDPEIN